MSKVLQRLQYKVGELNALYAFCVVFTNDIDIITHNIK